MQRKLKKITVLILILTVFTSLCGCDFLESLGGVNSRFSGLENGDIIDVITEEYYIFSPEFNSCYNVLNTKQKKIYEKIYAACDEMPKGFVDLCVDYEDASKDITVAYRAVLNDNTDIFWMPDQYIIAKNTTGGITYASIAFDHTYNKKTVKYPFTRSQREKMKTKLENTVQKVLELTKNAKSQFDKEKIFNDYICENTEYAENSELANTSYGCLVEKKALCEGYSRAFKLLCNRAKIECDLIVGSAEGSGHMWNSVNIDGKHSFVDVTWNDRPDYPYFYFNITNEQLEFDHTISPLYTELDKNAINSGKSFNFVERICSYKGNGYYEKYGYILGDDFDYDFAPKAAEFIKKSIEKDAEYADFLITSDNLKEEFLADEIGFISKIQKELGNVKINGYAFERDMLVIYFN